MAVFRPCLWLCLLLAVLAGSLRPGLAAADPLSAQVGAEIRRVLEGDEAQLLLGRELRGRADLLHFYPERNHAPAWVDDLGPTAAARELLEVLRGAAGDGFCPEDYHLRRIEALLKQAEFPRQDILSHPACLARLDLLLTDAFLRYASDLGNGRVGPADLPDGERSGAQPGDVGRALRVALAENRVSSVLADLAPAHAGYRQLRVELAGLRRLSALGGWPAIPDGPTLRRGQADPRLPLLRVRLLLGGDLPEPAAAGMWFDAATEAALVRFQRRHGLAADGVLGAKTLAELNVPVEARIRQVELNLERWRWFPRDPGENYLLVNIADFRLAVLEGGETVLELAVVVGTAYRMTPVFSARLTHLIFSPYWNVPPTILREDKLPKIQADPRYLGRERFEIVCGEGKSLTRIDPRTIRWAGMTPENFPGVLRMKPGKRNPLGRVKFIFPNPFDVYLHDTPDRHLFAREARTFSSGCIRVERPVDLAFYLLRGQGWDRERILEAMSRGEPSRVDLERPVPVHVVYRTAWIDAEGVLQLRPDVYLRDLDLEWALERRAREGLEEVLEPAQGEEHAGRGAEVGEEEDQ